MAESFDDEKFATIREAVCRMMADSMGKESEPTVSSPSVSERPSVDWPALQNDLEGLSAGQLTLVLNLIEEMKKVNVQSNEDSP